MIQAANGCHFDPPVHYVVPAAGLPLNQARKAVVRSFPVPNIVGAPVEYQVLTDLAMIAGPATIKCSPNSATTYKVWAMVL